jgi:hypothetical protein
MAANYAKPVTRFIQWGVVVLGSGAWLACATALHSQMKRDVSRQWSCPESQIEVVGQGKDVFRVSGCGQTAIFLCQPSKVGPAQDPHVGMAQEEEHRLQGGHECQRMKRDEP